ncbi:MAG TPA: endonuclease/exonuclease/phosphatase family protein [Prevotella sp.]
MFVTLLLAGFFTFVELNCENLFDCVDDTLKQDEEFLPDSYHHWTRTRYWRKLNHIGQEILSCGEHPSGWELPDMVALCEVENDSVLHDLTKRSLLRKAGYEYVMTNSPDVRGIDVALLYSPFSFRLLQYRSIRIPPLKDMRPTRDILYASGRVLSGDTLHVFVVHAPSRTGGEVVTRAYRMLVAERLMASVDSIRQHQPKAKMVVAGDFNDHIGDKSLAYICGKGLMDVSAHAVGSHGGKGTYRYRGEWGSLDHILMSATLAESLEECRINDAPFLLTDDVKYGGKQPFRTYIGPRYQQGFSDHLPLVARLRMKR